MCCVHSLTTQARLREAGLKVHTFNALLLYEPWMIQLDMSSWRGHFGTLMPFHYACRALGPPLKPLPTTIPDAPTDNNEVSS